eukprot:Hpha_TRINITY_DN16275_c2_g10::TRINITY_DN16275_c2_g10_i1::g.16127::m.16127
MDTAGAVDKGLLLRRRLAVVLRGFLAVSGSPTCRDDIAEALVDVAFQELGATVVVAALDRAKRGPVRESAPADRRCERQGMQTAIRSVRCSLALARSRSSVHTDASGDVWTLDHRTWSEQKRLPNLSLPDPPADPVPGTRHAVASVQTLSCQFSDACIQTEQTALVTGCSSPSASPVPSEWEAACDGEGSKYYWNISTREAQWSKPRSNAAPVGPPLFVSPLRGLLDGQSGDGWESNTKETPTKSPTLGASPVTLLVTEPSTGSPMPRTSRELTEDGIMLDELAVPDYAEGAVMDSDPALAVPWPSCRFHLISTPVPREGARLYHSIDLLLLDDKHADGPSPGLGPTKLDWGEAGPRKSGPNIAAGDVVVSKGGEGPLPKGVAAVVVGDSGEELQCWVPGPAGVPSCACRRSDLLRVEAHAKRADMFLAVVPASVTPAVLSAHFVRFAIALRRASRTEGYVDHSRVVEIWTRLLRLVRIWLLRCPQHYVDEKTRPRIETLLSLVPQEEGSPLEEALEDTKREVASAQGAKGVGDSAPEQPASVPECAAHL